MSKTDQGKRLFTFDSPEQVWASKGDIWICGESSWSVGEAEQRNEPIKSEYSQNNDKCEVRSARQRQRATAR